ncbi:OmpH family outer membrane protein [Neptunicella sp. SCSIO 80796]|uniref:OmpH family outer membrane protein n=1 Tax=Neptunicella plasticusilytica TaxID=3117012 RepID=UPI003A4DD90D
MKSLTKSLAVAAIMGTSMLSSAAYAAEKIGLVNVQAVFQSLPQTQAVEGTIREEFKDALQDVARMEKDIKYYLEKQQRDEATMSDAEKKELQTKLVALRDEYTSKAKPLQEDIQRRQGEERNKILGLIKQAIDSYAAKENFDLILNANAVAYVKNQSVDISGQITDQVSKIK